MNNHSFKNGLAWCAAIGVAMLGTSAALAQTWVYDATAKTISCEENGYTIKVYVGTKTDGTGAKVTGLCLNGVVTTGAGDTIDFTDFETEEGYRVIAAYGKLKYGRTAGLKKFIAPDLFETEMEMFYGYSSTDTSKNTLEEVVVSDRFASFQDRVFNNSLIKKLTPTSFPYVKTVGANVFSGLPITSISMPMVEKVGSSVFQGCTNLTGDLEFEHLTTIGEGAFRNTKITSFKATKAETLSRYAFYECLEVTNIVLGANCYTNLKAGLYANCPKLSEITPTPIVTTDEGLGTSFPFGTQSGKNTAYFAAHPLIIKGDGVTKIPNNFIKGSTDYQRIEIICNNIASIGSYAFQSIADGAEILWDGAAPTTVDSTAFQGNANVRKKIILKQAASADGWKSLSCFKAASDADKARADYPGKSKTLGVINGTTWLVKGWTSGMMILIR